MLGSPVQVWDCPPNSGAGRAARGEAPCVRPRGSSRGPPAARASDELPLAAAHARLHLLDVPGDLRLQLVGAAEAAFVAETAEDADLEGPAVEVSPPAD